MTIPMLLLTICSGLTACDDQSAVCDDLDALRASVNNLQDARIGENALSVISTALTNMESNLEQLSTDASAEYAPQVDEVRSQAATLEASIESAAANPSAAALSEVAEGVRAVGSAVRDLGDAVGGTC